MNLNYCKTFLLLGALFLSFEVSFSQTRIEKSQILILDQAKIVVVGKVEKFGSLPIASLTNDVYLCQTISLKVSQVLKGKLQEKKIKLNVLFQWKSELGLADVLDPDESYIFFLGDKDKVNECRYENLVTSEMPTLDAENLFPSYRIDFPSMVKANKDELRAIKNALRAR